MLLHLYLLQQGTSKSMPWLAELVDGNEGSLQVLPVQCLCEFLLQDSDSSIFDPEEDARQADKHKRRQVSLYTVNPALKGTSI